MTRGSDRSGPARVRTQERYGEAMITAIVFVKADVARIPEVAEAIASLDGVSEVYSVTGQIDLIALVRVREHEDVATVVADQLNKVEGVTETETHIAFRTYSRHDLESAFSIGLD
jgi:DNA-binding Lrp family transcriptional regulator